MSSNIIACGILQAELEQLLEQEESQVVYLDPAQHVNLEQLYTSLKSALQQTGTNSALIIGNRCHPDIETLAGNNDGKIIPAKNCIEMILGNRMADLNKEARTFFITGGWLQHWRSIFIEGLGWDEIDARQNFGIYERILLLDTGAVTIKDEQVLEFYEYTQVPIEVIPVEMDELKKKLEQTLAD